MESIIHFFTWLTSLITSFITGIVQFIKTLIITLYNMLYDLLCYIVEQILTFVISMINSIDLSGIPTLSSYLSHLPSEMINMIGLIRLPEALGIIVTALIIRFILQLIPFTRLGS